MKKVLILFFFLLFISGCSKEYTCTLNLNDNDLKYDDEITVKYDKDEMIKFVEELNLDKTEASETGITTYEEVKKSYNLLKKNKAMDIDIEDKNNLLYIKLKVDLKENKIDYVNSLNVSLSKDEFISNLEGIGYECK